MERAIAVLSLKAPGGCGNAGTAVRLGDVALDRRNASEPEIAA